MPKGRFLKNGFLFLLPFGPFCLMNPISNKYPETFGASLVVVVVVLRTDMKNNPIHTGASADDIITGAPNVRSDTRAAAIYMGP